MMDSSQNLRAVCEIFKRYTRRIHKKNTPRDPNFLKISIACAKIEQFIESIYPSQDPKALALVKAGRAPVVDEKKAAEEAEAKSDVFYLLLAVLGTLTVISALMIGAAYLAGARFDIVVKELGRGKIFPKHAPGSDAGQAIVHQHDHGEL